MSTFRSVNLSSHLFVTAPHLLNVCLPALILAGFNMTGSIPTELGLLTTLESIGFMINDLEGTIPTELCNLKELKSLQLSYNTMQGKIPDCIGDLQMLEILDLSDNVFDGTLPSSLMSITTLRGLYVDDNYFDGNPVDIWQGLTSIESLHAYDNDFTGDIRSLFAPAVHTELQLLDISHNDFTCEDGFPNHLLAMSSLVVLDASANKLSGKFPSIIEVNPKLMFLSMYDNSIGGKITGSIKNLTNLFHIDVSNNQLTGTMVSELGQIQTLARVYLSNNPNLEPGDVPESYANLTMLRELSLRNTSRIGPLPDFLAQNEDLMLLDLGSNNFSGPVPSSWKNLTNMEYMLLNANHDIDGDPSETLSFMIKLRAGFLDGTSVQGNFSDLCEAWSMIQTLPGEEVLIADCAGASSVVTCECCTCCDNANETGCSSPFLSNLDGEIETGFKRDFFQFTNDTIYTGNYQNLNVP
jgi:Leucine-rich repeat (LRR) protein